MYILIFSEMVHMKQLSVRCTHKDWQKYFYVDPHTIFHSKGFWRWNVLMDRWMDVEMVVILLW